MRWMREHKLMAAGFLILGALILSAVFVPVFSPYTYFAQNSGLQNLRASATHLFGTDKFGRDLFVRVWYGTRISLTVGIGSALINGIVGILWGGAAGLSQGKVDMLLMRIADILDSIPSLLYVILIMLALGANVGSILLGICISGWVELARIVRGEVMRQKDRDFCTAARLAGASPLRILFCHLLPNASGPIIVNLTFMIPKAIFTEAFLSFVGVGIAAPAASLGTLISDARSQMQVYPSQMLFPTAVLCILIFALHLIGAGLEQGVDSHEKGV